VMNAVNLIGRLTADPDLATRGSMSVCTMRLAIQRRRRGGEDQGAVFVDLVTFGAQAENCARFLAKGSLVAVAGRLEYGEWKAQDGSRRSKHEVIVEQVDFLSPRNTLTPRESEPQRDEPAAAQHEQPAQDEPETPPALPERVLKPIPALGVNGSPQCSQIACLGPRSGS
jgi:single-strand DNA-binding protein